MARLTKLRYRGTIPERQHDAFLLALLIAVSLNIAVFAVQALIPRLSSLLKLLGPEQAARMPEEEEAYPFVLVDPSFLDEEPDPEQLTEAEANVTRQARQVEAQPDLPDGFATIEEGIDDILTAPEGNPGPAVSYLQAPGGDAPEAGSDDQDILSENRETSESAPDQTDMAERAEQTEAAEAIPPAPAEPPPAPEIPPDEMREQQPPPVEQLESLPEEVEPAPAPMESPEPADQPDPGNDMPVEDMPDVNEDHPEPVAETEPEPVSEMVDVAALPLTSEGFFDPQTQRLEEILRRTEPVPPPPSERRDSREPLEPQPEQPRQPQQQPADPTQPQRARPQPTFKRIGGATASGGAPRRRNTNSAVRLLDSDASMALLAHRYGPYMEKLARQLQASLNRVMILSPMGYSRGQVKIRFGISPDGTLSYFDTVHPNDGSLEAERLLGEQMLREAAPFDPLTPAMQQDENFQRMTVIVHLY